MAGRPKGRLGEPVSLYLDPGTVSLLDGYRRHLVKGESDEKGTSRSAAVRSLVRAAALYCGHCQTPTGEVELIDHLGLCIACSTAQWVADMDAEAEAKGE